MSERVREQAGEGRDVPEFRVTVRVRNNLMITRREELGMSQAAIARAVGVGASEYNALETMRVSPLTQDNEWRSIALRVAEFHGLSPDDLWPESVLRVKDPCLTREFGERELMRLTGRNPERVLMESELDEAAATLALDTIGKVMTRREREIVIAVYRDGETFAAAGAEHGISANRAWQIALHGLQKARVAIDQESLLLRSDLRPGDREPTTRREAWERDRQVLALRKGYR